MRVIYEPKGRAREYAALAVNLFTGCTHGCKYCYAPRVARKTAAEWAREPQVREGLLAKLERDAADLAEAGCEDEILMSFMTDPYMADWDGEVLFPDVTRRALEILGEAGLRVTVLTKGGERAAHDFDYLQECGFRFGQSISWSEEWDAAQWEPNTSPLASRSRALQMAHRAGIETWVSVEPVIDPCQALQVIESLAPWVDEWRVGKLNHNAELEKRVNWRAFAVAARDLLESIGAPYVLKNDLKAYLEDE